MAMRLSSWKIRLLIGYTGTAAGTCFLLLAVGFAVYEVSFLARSSEAQGTVIANPGVTNRGTRSTDFLSTVPI
jgi:hypothetical protein